MTIKDICTRDPATIEKDIAALEKEITPDNACEKKSYPANVIRYDIALLQRDVHQIAIGIAEVLENQAEIMERQHRQWAILETLLQIRSLERAALLPDQNTNGKANGDRAP